MVSHAGFRLPRELVPFLFFRFDREQRHPFRDVVPLHFLQHHIDVRVPEFLGEPEREQPPRFASQFFSAASMASFVRPLSVSTSVAIAL